MENVNSHQSYLAQFEPCPEKLKSILRINWKFEKEFRLNSLHLQGYNWEFECIYYNLMPLMTSRYRYCKTSSCKTMFANKWRVFQSILVIFIYAAYQNLSVLICIYRCNIYEQNMFYAVVFEYARKLNKIYWFLFINKCKTHNSPWYDVNYIQWQGLWSGVWRFWGTLNHLLKAVTPGSTLI